MFSFFIYLTLIQLCRSHVKIKMLLFKELCASEAASRKYHGYYFLIPRALEVCVWGGGISYITSYVMNNNVFISPNTWKALM